MAHTAEDLCEMYMDNFDVNRCGHDDVKNGFALYFPETKPDVDILELERKVQEVIAQDLPVTYVDEHHISVGGNLQECTGPRIHVSSTGKIENFKLLHHFIYNRFSNKYLLVGCVGKNALENLQKLDAQQAKQSELIL